jgi:hypothetical protein
MLVVFNWNAVPLFAGSLTSGILFWVALEAIGVRRDIAFGSGAALAGLILVIVDYVILRRRNAPLAPLWRLILPDAGGHIFFIPCWVQGAFCILAGRLGLGGSLDTGNGSVLSVVLTFLGFSGALIPIAYELFLPIELRGR